MCDNRVGFDSLITHFSLLHVIESGLYVRGTGLACGDDAIV